MATATPVRSANARRWRLITRVLQVLLGICILGAVWLLAFNRNDGQLAVLPDTNEQFSLDLEVIAAADHPLVYAVEQRARPAYRIFSFEPATGDIQTVFEVPEDAIIFGMALSPDASTLALAYSTDFDLGGSGISLLDLASGDLTELLAVEPSTYLADLVWASDGGSIYATAVDRHDAVEVLSVVEIAHDGAVTTVAEDGISPAVAAGEIFYLTVDETNARRSIGVVGGTTISVGDGSLDLDHLIAATDGTSLSVAVIEGSDTTVTIGDPAGAHGNHDVASTWWTLRLDGGDAEPTAFEPIIVYDGVLTDTAIVYATSEGLSIAVDDERVDLIKSRAIRLIAG